MEDDGARALTAVYVFTVWVCIREGISGFWAQLTHRWGFMDGVTTPPSGAIDWPSVTPGEYSSNNAHRKAFATVNPLLSHHKDDREGSSQTSSCSWGIDRGPWEQAGIDLHF